jgi:hypothetical protein
MAVTSYKHLKAPRKYNDVSFHLTTMLKQMQGHRSVHAVNLQGKEVWLGSGRWGNLTKLATDVEQNKHFTGADA